MAAAAPVQIVQQAPAPAKQPPTAIVVGAGPAGIVAASLLARRGLRVRVFERREEPKPDELLTGRSFALGVNGRTVTALEAAGLDIQSVGKHPYKGVIMNRKFMPGSHASDPTRRLYFVDRLRLGQELVQAAKQQTFPEGGGIEWHFGQALEDVDFDARTATFVPWTRRSSSPGASGEDGQEDGGAATTSSKIIAQYDLLVGADGGTSAVRAKMLERKVPGLSEELVLTALTSWRSFHRLEATPAIEKALPGISTFGAGDVLWMLSGLHQGHAYVVNLRKQWDGSISGAVSAPEQWFDERTAREVVDAALSDGLEEWREPVWAQINEASGQRTSHLGPVYKPSQIYGPSTVLVGDAAHPVTPSLGQGCSYALESACVLAETLDKVGVDQLEQLPAAYNAARMDDVRAIQDMDWKAAVSGGRLKVLLGPERQPPSAWQKLSAFVELILPTLTVWPLLKLLAPKHFVEPTFTFFLVGLPKVRLAHARALMRVVGWASAVGLVAAVAALLRAVAGKVLGV